MGVLVALYPRAGATVLDESGGVVPSSGGRYDATRKHYSDLIIRGDLLRVDPQGVGSARLLTGAVLNSLAGSLNTSLPTRPGNANGEQVITYGHTSAGDRGGAAWCFLLGASAGANALTKINASNGQWQMMLDGGELNVARVGVFPDGSDCTSRVNSLIATLAAEGSRSVVSLYFPKGARSYYFSGPILPPTVDTAESTAIRLIVRGDRGEGASQAAYGNAAYTSTTFYTGTSLQFAAGSVGFDLWQDGDVRTALSLRDLCVQGSGAGSVGIDMYGDGEADSVVRFDAENVTTVGFQTGIALYTFQPMRCPGLRTYGHSEHIRVRGAATVWISDSEHQGGDDVFVFDQALNMAIRGFLIQGTTGAAIKVNDVGVVGVRAVHFSDGHIETTGVTIEDAAANLNKTVRIRISNTRIAQTVLANTFNLYGGGWDLDKSCSGMAITATSYDFRLRSDDGDFTLTASSDAQYELDSQYRRLVTLGLPQSNLAVSGGNLVYNAPVAGSLAQHTLTADVNLVVPTNFPFGKLMVVVFAQDGTGGWDITPVGLGLGSEWTLSMAGNTASTHAVLMFTRNTDGGTVGQQCRLIYWSGWR